MAVEEPGQPRGLVGKVVHARIPQSAQDFEDLVATNLAHFRKHAGQVASGPLAGHRVLEVVFEATPGGWSDGAIAELEGLLGTSPSPLLLCTTSACCACRCHDCFRDGRDSWLERRKWQIALRNRPTSGSVYDEHGQRVTFAGARCTTLSFPARSFPTIGWRRRTRRRLSRSCRAGLLPSSPTPPLPAPQALPTSPHLKAWFSPPPLMPLQQMRRRRSVIFNGFKLK